MGRKRFNEAYKEWRNRARKYDRDSIVAKAIDALGDAPRDPMAELASAPWITLLLVKWACQDRYARGRRLPTISRRELEDLRQRLWKLPERVERDGRDGMPPRLFMRQLIRPQLGFQRDLTKSFVREAGLLAAQGEDYPLRSLFREKTGFDVVEFIDLSFATYAAVADGRRVITDTWFSSLQPACPANVVSCFRTAMGRTVPELVSFCRSLPDAKRKVASEFFEFPALTRYPFLRTEVGMTCWHPMVFYRGLESFVHSVLGEEGQTYMDRFGRLFERHVLGEARRVPAPFFDEETLRGWIADGSQVPDGLLSFPGCNVFVESKAGLFGESVMAVGNDEMFARKTRAVTKAVGQAWAASVSLRRERRAPRAVLDAEVDYLLVVTNKELGASRGRALADMYPDGTLEYPDAEAERLLPRDRVYVLSIDDFERLANAAADETVDLPGFLASCVEDDGDPERALHLFEQHLDRRAVARRFSLVVEDAADASLSRLEGVLGGASGMAAG